MSARTTFHLPGGSTGFELEELSPELEDPRGPAQSIGSRRHWARFSPDGARSLLDSLRRSRPVLDRRKSVEIIRTLGRVGRRFTDPTDSLRIEAEARLPDEAAISSGMATAIIDGMARDWDAGRLERLLSAEFPDPLVLDGFRPDGESQVCRAWGPSLALHVASGNVPGVGVTSIIRSLIVKSPVLLKPGRGDISLPLLFVRGLGQEDPTLAGAVAIVYWPRGEGGALEELVIAEADVAVAHGGDGFVRQLRRRIPPTTPLVAYHHRISVGAVARDELRSPASAAQVALHAARSVALFDQRGCVSPRVIWVEEGGEMAPADWAPLLASHLGRLGSELPSPSGDLTAGARLRQRIDTVELKTAAGGQDRVFSAGPGGTVFFESEPAPFEPVASAGRAVVVKPIADLGDLADVLQPWRRWLQTLAVAAPDARRLDLAERLLDSGITRVTTFARQPWPPAWWRHDGKGALRTLVRWVVMETDEPPPES